MSDEISVLGFGVVLTGFEIAGLLKARERGIDAPGHMYEAEQRLLREVDELMGVHREAAK